jgi:hypothetical protein
MLKKKTQNKAVCILIIIIIINENVIYIRYCEKCVKLKKKTLY